MKEIITFTVCFAILMCVSAAGIKFLGYAPNSRSACCCKVCSCCSCCPGYSDCCKGGKCKPAPKSGDLEP